MKKAPNLDKFFREVKDIYFQHHTIRLGQAVWCSFSKAYCIIRDKSELDCSYSEDVIKIRQSILDYFCLPEDSINNVMIGNYLRKLKKERKCTI